MSVNPDRREFWEFSSMGPGGRLKDGFWKKGKGELQLRSSPTTVMKEPE
jgi:hypothetical protein